MSTYPKWIGLSGWHLMSRHGTRYGIAALVLGPGKIGDTVQCDHRHRKQRLAEECGKRMAAERDT